MMKLKNGENKHKSIRSIGRILFYAFTCIIFFLVLQGIVNISASRLIIKTVSETDKKESSFEKLIAEFVTCRLLVFELITTDNPYQMDELRKRYGEAIKEIYSLANELKLELEPLNQIDDLYREIIEAHYAHASNISRLLMKNDAKNRYEAILSDYKEIILGIYSESNTINKKAYRQSLLVTIALCLIALLVAFVWALLLRRSLTYKREADHALKASEKKYQDLYYELVKVKTYLECIINSMPSIIIGFDNSGNIAQYNRGAEFLSGINAVNAAEKNLIDIFPGNIDVIERINLAIENRQFEDESRIIFNLMGEERIINWSVFPVSVEYELGMVLRIDDVTEKTKFDELVIQTEKMISIGSLAAGMAHEINNPLGAILQSVQNIERRVDPEREKNSLLAKSLGVDINAIEKYLDEQKVFKFINAVKESGVRAAKIVESMLAFSRRSVSEKSAISILKVIDNSIELACNDYNLKKSFDFRHIIISKDIDSDYALVKGVENELEQVFLNLFKNSAQALHEAGVREPRIEITTSMLANKLRVAVSDNGPGMNIETQKRIFEPFFTTKSQGHGTGLGLSVSYFIITENHNGSMYLESKEGHGTTFFIELPIAI